MASKWGSHPRNESSLHGARGDEAAGCPEGRDTPRWNEFWTQPPGSFVGGNGEWQRLRGPHRHTGTRAAETEGAAEPSGIQLSGAGCRASQRHGTPALREGETLTRGRAGAPQGRVRDDT